MILHIVSKNAWAQAQGEGAYRADSLAAQGFIHFSLPEQVVGTANRFYAGQTSLALLVVDPAKLQAELRYEPPAEAPESSERFPHLYGALNLDAVVRVVDFPPDADGHWSALPVGIQR
ncbi:MAG: DUF952 domain-containing protein [Chloroflexi bacterium]|nr:DUF952 domain-containing protein [Chloroflexota bacterium]